jgi:hypothetical protein
MDAWPPEGSRVARGQRETERGGQFAIANSVGWEVVFAISHFLWPV